MGLLFGGGGQQLGIAFLRRIPILRWIGPGITSAGLAALVYFVMTGRIDLSQLDGSGGAPAATTVQPVSLEALGEKSRETIRIATFNIQVFGDKKSQDADVMRVLAQTMMQFDVVAIQEVRGGNGVPVERLVELINHSSGSYHWILSEPIGRTAQKESYAYVWDQSRISLVPDSAYVVDDATDRMHREPMVASFQARTAAADGRLPFRFTLINAHTDPDEVGGASGINELDVLDDVFVRVRQYEYERYGEEDCLLLGDLNVNAAKLSELGKLPNVFSVAGDLKTNTRRTQTYDHIVQDSTLTTEFTGRFGVLDLQLELGLSEDQAIRVSDHMPVWAEYSAYESPRSPAIATDRSPSTAVTR